MTDLFTWLDDHAGAVQAVSAVVSAILTGFIARLTFQYVRLTGTIATAAQKQVEIAQLQADTAKNLEAAARQQRELEQDRASEARAREQAAARLAKRQLSGLAARFLTQFAGCSSTAPSEAAFRILPPISEADIQALRDAANAAGIEAFDVLESVLSALAFMAELQQRVKNTNPAAGYSFSKGETQMYESTLRNLRSGLKAFTEFRPTSEVY
jgi:hypothetical protein